MDIVTHSMTGVLIGSVAATRRDKLYAVVLAGVSASALPDLDVVLYLIDIELYYTWHRVFTHTLIGAPLFALLGVLPAWLWVRERYAFLYLVALVSIGVHLAMDVLCDWPLLLLFPFSRKDFALGYIHYSSMILLIIMTILAVSMLFYRKWSEKPGE